MSILTTIVISAIGVNKFVERLKAPPLVVDGYWDGNFTEDGEAILSVLHLASRENALDGSMIENRGSLLAPKKIKSTLKGTINGTAFSLEKICHYKNGLYAKTKLVGNFSVDGKEMHGIYRWKFGTGKFVFRKNE